MRAFVASVILLSSAGCGSEKNTRAEAIELLERISRLDVNGSQDARAAAIAAIEAMPLREPELRAAREQCVAAHGGLLNAERAQREVEHELEQSARPIDAAKLETLKARMSEANGALEAAGKSLGPCEERTRALALRYAR